MKKTNIIAGALVVTTLGLLGSFTLTKAHAENSDYQSKSLIQTIVEKFNLNSDEVQKVIDEYRSVKHEDRKSALEDRLSYLVYKGSITEDQKSKILAKFDEIKSKSNDFWKLTKEERKTRMEQQREELQKWASDNGIDEKYMFMLGHGGNFGEGKGWGNREQL